MTKILFVVAHGENWEVAASHAVADLVKKIIKEHIHNQGPSEENGTFSLQYKSTNSNRTAIVIPLSSQNKSPEPHLEQETKRVSFFQKVEHVEA